MQRPRAWPSVVHGLTSERPDFIRRQLSACCWMLGLLHPPQACRLPHPLAHLSLVTSSTPLISPHAVSGDNIPSLEGFPHAQAATSAHAQHVRRLAQGPPPSEERHPNRERDKGVQPGAGRARNTGVWTAPVTPIEDRPSAGHSSETTTIPAILPGGPRASVQTTSTTAGRAAAIALAMTTPIVDRPQAGRSSETTTIPAIAKNVPPGQPRASAQTTSTTA
jgi:hypothetical protein